LSGTLERPEMGTATPKHQMTPRATVKDKARKQIVKDRKVAYVLVEGRDAMRCRCCGKPLVRSQEMRLDKLEHHHIDGRQVAEAETTANICCICRECHDERHVKRTLKIEGSADGRLRMEQGGRVWTTWPIKPITKKQREAKA
jgi:heterodisulfide reductase subunit B